MGKQKLLWILSLVLIFLLCSGLIYSDQKNKEMPNSRSTVNKPVSSKTNLHPNKKINTDSYVYIHYKVKAKDDLYSLAHKFMPTYEASDVVKVIEKKNNLNGATIYINSTLLIPAEKDITYEN